MSTKRYLAEAIELLSDKEIWLLAVDANPKISGPARVEIVDTIVSHMRSRVDNGKGIITYEECTSPAPRAETATGVSILEAPLASSNFEVSLTRRVHIIYLVSFNFMFTVSYRLRRPIRREICHLQT